MDLDKRLELLTEHIERVAKQVSQLSDVITVVVGKQERYDRFLTDHREWLEGITLGYQRHEEMLVRHQGLMAEHAAMMVKIDEKLDRIADLILKGRGPNGH